jgi:hypothetical protein
MFPNDVGDVGQHMQFGTAKPMHIAHLLSHLCARETLGSCCIQDLCIATCIPCLPCALAVALLALCLIAPLALCLGGLLALCLVVLLTLGFALASF